MVFKPRTPRIYEDFNEIRDEVLNSDIKVLYKYRDWEKDYHKRMLTENEIWFSNPNEFNDIFDVHIPFEFDYSEIEDPLFLEKIKLNFSTTQGIDVTSRECEVRSENLLDQIRADPKWFENNKYALRKDPEINSVGVFSTSLDWDKNKMWAHYSNSHRGFCLGFPYPGLMAGLEAMAQPVHYIKEKLKFSFLKYNPFMDEFFFIKEAQWEDEREYRFVTLGIRNDSQRAVKFDPAILHHVIFGYKMPQSYREEIIEILKTNYKSKPRLYITKVDATSYDLTLERLNY